MSDERIARHCICCAGTQLDRSPAVLMPFVALRVFGHEPVEITQEWGLRDLQQGMAYTLCTSLQCQQCGVLFLDYRFSDEEMRRLYDGYRDERYNHERLRFEPGYGVVSECYQRRAAYIADVERWLQTRVTPSPRVLDWGGDSGINTPFLGASMVTHVYDISSVAPVEGVQVVDLDAVKRNRYDLITCSQVLEHVAYPHHLLEQIAAVMDEQTLLYLEVPCEALMREHPGNLGLAQLKRHWHEHVNFFTEESMRALLRRCGLQLQEIMNLDIDLGWKAGTLLGLLARRSVS